MNENSIFEVLDSAAGNSQLKDDFDCVDVKLSDFTGFRDFSNYCKSLGVVGDLEIYWDELKNGETTLFFEKVH